MLALLPLLMASHGADLPVCDETRAEMGIQSAMNICAHRDYVVADEALNTQWKITAAKMRERDEAYKEWSPDDGRAGYFDSLLEAQRAWLAYRDAHCRAEGYLARGGSMEALLASFCLRDLTVKRTEELQSLAEWPE